MRKQKRESLLVMSMIFLTITITNIAREKKKGQSYKSASNIYTKRKTYVVLHQVQMSPAEIQPYPSPHTKTTLTSYFMSPPSMRFVWKEIKLISENKSTNHKLRIIKLALLLSTFQQQYLVSIFHLSSFSNYNIFVLFAFRQSIILIQRQL